MKPCESWCVSARREIWRSWRPEAFRARAAWSFCGGRRSLTLDGARCALCLDDGMLLGAARRRPFCEVELELVSGEAAPMLAFAAYLQEHHALREERKSKFVRASELVD